MFVLSNEVTYSQSHTLREVKAMTITAKRNILTAAIILTLILIMGCIIVYAKTPSQGASQSRPKYFTSYEIKAGDTLSGIAKQFITSEYSSADEYISEVRSINGFTGDTLYAGAYLVLPYYADKT